MICKKCKKEIYILVLPNILTKDASMDIFQCECGRVIAMAHSNTEYFLSHNVEV